MLHNQASLNVQQAPGHHIHLATLRQLITLSIILVFLVGTGSANAMATTTSAAPLLANRAPNTPVLVQPGNNSTNIVTSPALQVTANDPDPADTLSVQFYGRFAPVSPGGDFTLVVLPDIQYETGYAPEMLQSQMEYIVAQRNIRNIAFVTSVGDLVNTPYQDSQYTTADQMFDILDGGNIPYSVGPGNHDQGEGTLFNEDRYFGVARFAGKPWYGGHYGSDNFNNYSLFSASGLDFILINLQYLPTQGQLDWADNLLKMYPNRRAIVEQHDILDTDDSWLNTSGFDALKDNPNLFLMLCGHMHTQTDGAAYRLEQGDDGHTIHIVLANYQQWYANGENTYGNGWTRFLKFSPVNNTISMTTYSPYTGQSLNQSPDQMDLQYDEDPAFALIGTASGITNGGLASVNWPALQENTSYEWYAVVSDGTTTTTGPTWKFTTGTMGNHSPVITEPSPALVSMSEDGAPTAFNLTLHATDPDAGDILTWAIAAPASHGTASVSGTGTSKAIGYSPALNFFGIDSFVVQVSDGKAGVDTITVQVTVINSNDAPVANAQTITTTEDTGKSITLTGTDVDGDTLTFYIVTPPVHGNLTGNGANVIYTPNRDYYGSDSFTFRTRDGAVYSDSAIVSITVTPVNDAPVALMDRYYISPNQTVTVPSYTGVLANDTDADDTTLTATVVSSPVYGSLSFNAANGSFTYTPQAGYIGAVSFTYQANDGDVNSNVAQVQIYVQNKFYLPGITNR